jgi:hypothetical protein
MSPPSRSTKSASYRSRVWRKDASIIGYRQNLAMRRVKMALVLGASPERVSGTNEGSNE